MSINDLLEQGVQIQGAYIVKSYCEESDKYIVLSEGDHFEHESHNINEEYLDAEITYLYSEDNVLNIEIANMD